MAKKPNLTGSKQAQPPTHDAQMPRSDATQGARLPNGQFPPGVSGNPSGRPVGSVDPLKEIGRKIADERVALGLTTKQRRRLVKAGVPVENLTVVENIMRDWAYSTNPIKQERFLERVYGKVPNVNFNQNSSFDFMRHADKFTDSELEAIRDGADPLDMLFSKIPDADIVKETVARIKGGEDALQVLNEMMSGIFGGIEL